MTIEIQNKEDLITVFNDGEKIKYLFFWGHRESEEITKSCFSQWFPAEFTIDTITYPTAEHYMMAEKARLFDDQAMLEQILSAPHPKAAKGFGRGVKNFDAKVWEAHCYDIVIKANLAKFSQNVNMGEFLLNTNDRVLVEASPFDEIWGIGMAQDDVRCTSPDQWNGENLLGFALMKVRKILKES